MCWVSAGPGPLHPSGHHPASGHGQRPVQHPGLGVGLRRRDCRGAGAAQHPGRGGGQDGQVGQTDTATERTSPPLFTGLGVGLAQEVERVDL